MASSIRAHVPEGGLTVSALLFLEDSTTPVTVACTETSTNSGVYEADMAGQPAGKYGVRFTRSGLTAPTDLVAAGDFEWDGTNIITRASRASAAALAVVNDFVDTLEASVAALPASTTSAVLAAIIEGTTTLRQSLALANAANAGTTQNMQTANATIKALDGVTDRVTAVLDQQGNRTSVTTNFTDITI